MRTDAISITDLLDEGWKFLFTIVKGRPACHNNRRAAWDFGLLRHVRAGAFRVHLCAVLRGTMDPGNADHFCFARFAQEKRNRRARMRRMAKGKIVKTNIFLRADQMAALRKLSAETDVPVARLIRRGMDLLLLKPKR